MYQTIAQVAKFLSYVNYLSQIVFACRDIMMLEFKYVRHVPNSVLHASIRQFA